MKTKTSVKEMDLSTIKPLSRAEQSKIIGGKAEPEVETENFVGIAIAVAGAAKALGH